MLSRFADGGGDRRPLTHFQTPQFLVEGVEALAGL